MIDTKVALLTVAIVATTYSLAPYISPLLGVLAGFAVWWVSNFLGRPIVEIESKRIEALKTAERYTWIAPPQSERDEDRVIAGRDALRDMATELRAYARGPSQLVRWYCKLRGYDLDGAYHAMTGLRMMAGSSDYGRETRQNNLDVLYIALRACPHLSVVRIKELKRMLAEAVEAETAAKVG